MLALVVGTMAGFNWLRCRIQRSNGAIEDGLDWVRPSLAPKRFGHHLVWTDLIPWPEKHRESILASPGTIRGREPLLNRIDPFTPAHAGLDAVEPCGDQTDGSRQWIDLDRSGFVCRDLVWLAQDGLAWLLHHTHTVHVHVTHVLGHAIHVVLSELRFRCRRNGRERRQAGTVLFFVLGGFAICGKGHGVTRVCGPTARTSVWTQGRGRQRSRQRELHLELFGRESGELSRVDGSDGAGRTRRTCRGARAIQAIVRMKDNRHGRETR